MNRSEVKTVIDVEFNKANVILESYKKGELDKTWLIDKLMEGAPTITSKLFNLFVDPINTNNAVGIDGLLATKGSSQVVAALFEKYGIIKKTDDAKSKYILTDEGKDELISYLDYVENAFKTERLKGLKRDLELLDRISDELAKPQ